MSMSEALYALSLYVLGMAITRIILGKRLTRVSSKTILVISVFLLAAGGVVIQAALSQAFVVTGLILLGAGLAAGFPVMLGFVGERYKAVSGTAFSIVISMALVGSMVTNYLMGLIAEHYGIQHLTTVGIVLTTLMLLFLLGIFRKLSTT
jgi:MFS family permease